ncbi:SCO family protein [Alsobacter soli]|uniref:SCO family protein n=1 Tax=Alsobacter soli TaxID=2109933 RepID=A0A2T1HYB0_9HYPH|nr:SCO family protein [Alsobacter soli]PSC06479.1 SCO family protein [Alsobacter soli]
MKRRLAPVLLLAILLQPGAARAALTRSELDGVRSAAAPGAVLPLDAAFRDASGRPLRLRDALGGRPALLIPVDYACRSLCGPALALVGAAADAIPAQRGRDYRIVAVGMDPAQTPEQARAMVAPALGDPGDASGTVALVGSADAIGRLFAALGYTTSYDAGERRYAHPAAAYAVTAEGRVSRALSTFALDRDGLRLALMEAGQGRIGGFTDRLALLCYGFDPALGAYTPAIRRILAGAGVLTLIGMALAIAALARAARRRDARAAP